MSHNLKTLSVLYPDPGLDTDFYNLASFCMFYFIVMIVINSKQTSFEKLKQIRTFVLENLNIFSYIDGICPHYISRFKFTGIVLYSAEEILKKKHREELKSNFLVKISRKLLANISVNNKNVGEIFRKIANSNVSSSGFKKGV